MVSALVIDLDLSTANQWLGLLVSVTVIAGFAWAIGRLVFRCFDDTRKEVRRAREVIDDLRQEMLHEAEMQKHRHVSNQAALGQTREKIAQIDADLTRARLDIAANTALIKRHAAE